MTKKKIGSAKERSGLYHLDFYEILSLNVHNRNVFSVTCNKDELWHYRLGHLSKERMAIINNKFPDVDVPSDFICICL